MDDTYATAIPPGCRCKWELQGVGLTGDSPPIPWGAVATWFVLLVRHPKCRYHGTEDPT